MEDLKSKPATEETKKNESPRRGARGEVGAHNMKGLWHSFQRKEGRKAKRVSMKTFAHQIAETGTDEEKVIALDWFKHKAELKRNKR